jgi:hypothetical protein
MPDEELDKIYSLFAPVMDEELEREFGGGLTGADIVALMMGQAP